MLEEIPDLQVQIIFTASNQEQDIKSLPVRHFLAIEEKYRQEQLVRALDDWYHAPVKDYESFAARYVMNDELKMQEAKIEAMFKWCNRAEVAFTPTYYFNGYRLPEMYAITDMKYFLKAEMG